jgi:hypothetical protein
LSVKSKKAFECSIFSSTEVSDDETWPAAAAVLLFFRLRATRTVRRVRRIILKSAYKQKWAVRPLWYRGASFDRKICFKLHISVCHLHGYDRTDLRSGGIAGGPGDEGHCQDCRLLGLSRYVSRDEGEEEVALGENELRAVECDEQTSAGLRCGRDGEDNGCSDNGRSTQLDLFELPEEQLTWSTDA